MAVVDFVVVADASVVVADSDVEIVVVADFAVAIGVVEVAVVVVVSGFVSSGSDADDCEQMLCSGLRLVADQLSAQFVVVWCLLLLLLTACF